MSFPTGMISSIGTAEDLVVVRAASLNSSPRGVSMPSARLARADAIYLVSEVQRPGRRRPVTLDDLPVLRLAHATRQIYLTFTFSSSLRAEGPLHHLGECNRPRIDAAIVQDVGAVR